MYCPVDGNRSIVRRTFLDLSNTTRIHINDQEVLMPYPSNSDLPESVQNVLPKHAQDIYREAYNSAWEQYDTPEERHGDSSREETAHKVAWAAVKKQYEKNESSGKWRRKKS